MPPDDPRTATLYVRENSLFIERKRGGGFKMDLCEMIYVDSKSVLLQVNIYAIQYTTLNSKPVQ